jgi:hypothetical protein
MVKAVKGMVAETNQILGAYVMTIIFFTFSTIGVYWIMMPVDAAIVSSIITVLGMGMWYHFVLRIFNRFQWSSTAGTLLLLLLLLLIYYFVLLTIFFYLQVYTCC